MSKAPTESTTNTDLSGELVAGRFHVIQRIGKGGYGEVYAAEQVSMGRKVALKVLSKDLADDPRVIERFYREARQTCQLTHTNTVVCYDFGEDRDRHLLYLAMEYLDGCTLLDIIEREGAISPIRTLGIIEQVAASLQEAHDRGIIHRDLKPANIMLITREGNNSFVKVIDFGIAVIFNQSQQEQQADHPRLTRSGMVMGTPHYMAPEQIRHQPLDHRVDVYALGVLTFEMLAGRRPFVGQTPIDIMRKHLEARPPLLHTISSGLSPSLSALMNWVMAKAPADRPQSVVEFANAFRDALLQNEDNTARVSPQDARSLQHFLQSAHSAATASAAVNPANTNPLKPVPVAATPAATAAANAKAAKIAKAAAAAAANTSAFPSSPQDNQANQDNQDNQEPELPLATFKMSAEDIEKAAALEYGTRQAAEAASIEDDLTADHDEPGADATSQMSLGDVEAIMRLQQQMQGADSSTTDIGPLVASGPHPTPSSVTNAALPQAIPQTVPSASIKPVPASPPSPRAKPAQQPNNRTLIYVIAALLVAVVAAIAMLL